MAATQDVSRVLLLAFAGSGPAPPACETLISVGLYFLYRGLTTTIARFAKRPDQPTVHLAVHKSINWVAATWQPPKRHVAPTRKLAPPAFAGLSLSGSIGRRAVAAHVGMDVSGCLHCINSDTPHENAAMLVLIQGRSRMCEVGGCSGPAEFMDKQPTNFGYSWTDYCGVCARIAFGDEALIEAQEALSCGLHDRQ